MYKCLSLLLKTLSIYHSAFSFRRFKSFYWPCLLGTLGREKNVLKFISTQIFEKCQSLYISELKSLEY